MATIAESPITVASSKPAESVEPILGALLVRLRTLLWLSSGLFSAASFAIPVIGVLAFGSYNGLGTSFLVAIVSACLFGLTSFLHFGPDVA